jgi:hypothetical protein
LKSPKICVIIGENFSLNGIYNPANKGDIERGSEFIRNRIAELKVLSQNEWKCAKEPKGVWGKIFPMLSG